MIVTNVVITFVLVTGITLVTCATTSPDKRQNLESRRDDAPRRTGRDHRGVLSRAHSNLEVAGRFSTPAASLDGHEARVDNPKHANAESKRRGIIEKLKLSVALRDNILYVFSYLLHGRESGLTEEQYAALRMLYDVLRKRTVHVYDVLPALLSKLENNGDKNQQTRHILLSLVRNLPPYLQCTAKFLINEIELGRINLDVLLGPTKTGSETFNYLADVDPSAVASKSNLGFVGEEMRGHDKYSNITEKILGPVFVYLLHNPRDKNLPLSQDLFGLILMNLPNPSDDPVLEENVKYLYDVTKFDRIMNWELIGKEPVRGDVYSLVFSVLSRILVNSNAGNVRNAAVYVYNHLKHVAPYHANPYSKYMYNSIKQNVDMGMLLAAIVPQEFSPDVVYMKDRLLTYFMRNYGNGDLDQALKGFNRFNYREPMDLLMAFLTRLLNRMPTSKPDVLQPTATLLSSLIVKKHVRSFTPFVSPDLDILILLESLKNPDLDPVLSSMIDSIQLELIAQPRVSVLLSNLIPTEKSKCLTPRQCLTYALQQVQRLRGNVPVTLMTKIQRVLYMLSSTAPMRYQPQTFSTRYSVIPGNVEPYNVDQESPVVVVVEADIGHAHNVPNGLDQSPYARNVDKYISETGPVTQDGSSGTSGWEQGAPTATNFMETMKEVSLNQSHLTEYVPSDNVADQSHALTFSLTTASPPSSYPPSQISYNAPSKGVNQETASIPSGYDIGQQKIPRKQSGKKSKKQPQMAQSHRATYTTTPENVAPEGHSFEIEYPYIPEATIHETKESHKSYTSNESEEVQPSEEMDSLRKKLVQPDKVDVHDDQMETPTHLTKPHKISTKKTSSTKTHEVQEKISESSQEVPRTTTPVIKKQERPRIESEDVIQNVPYGSTSPESLEAHELTNESISPTDDEQSRSRHETKPTIVKSIEEETSNAENASVAMVFPPSIKPDRPLTVQLSNSGVPVVTTDVDDRNTTAPGQLVLPDIVELLKAPDAKDLLGNVDTPVVTQVLKPLSVIFGKNYIQKILKDTNVNDYSTNIALLSAILRKAKGHPQVAKNPDLLNLIQKYSLSIDYVSPTILLPVVTSSKRLVSEIVYSSFNPHDLTHSEISENPPSDREISDGSVTVVPLVNPKTWLQSVNPSDPYAGLLPTLPKGHAFETTIRPLKAILTIEKITEILGPDFKPLLYPNKGALLITLLRKLRKAKVIQSKPALKSVIEMYTHAIEIPSMNIHVSGDRFVKMMSETTGHWQPELTSLIYALPKARNEAEIAMIETMENFLADASLLEKLHVTKPSSSMSRGELLRKIIANALSDKMRPPERNVLRALKYYKDRVKLNDMGALPLVWMWVEVYVVKTEVKLGEMIEKLLDFERLAYKEKLAYNELVTYLAENPEILQHNEDFAFDEYKTQGAFIRALFKYLLKKPRISGKTKRNIRMLLPRVNLTGAGAVMMPNLPI